MIDRTLNNPQTNQKITVDYDGVRIDRVLAVRTVADSLPQIEWHRGDIW